MPWWTWLLIGWVVVAASVALVMGAAAAVVKRRERASGIGRAALAGWPVHLESAAPSVQRREGALVPPPRDGTVSVGPPEEPPR